MYTFEKVIKTKRIEIINGPNLNLLGRREPEIYGSLSFEDYLEELKKEYPSVEIGYFQSNVEGELINHIQRIGLQKIPILFNAGGYTHTSVAIADAVAAIPSEVIEIHISQPAAREEERHTSLLAKYCKGSISGLGLKSYKYGLNYFIENE